MFLLEKNPKESYLSEFNGISISMMFAFHCLPCMMVTLNCLKVVSNSTFIRVVRSEPFPRRYVRKGSLFLRLHIVIWRTHPHIFKKTPSSCATNDIFWVAFISSIQRIAHCVHIARKHSPTNEFISMFNVHIVSASSPFCHIVIFT